MRIAVLDDHQDVVRGLSCFALLREHDVRVFGTPDAAEDPTERLAPFEALVLIRERTAITRALLGGLPGLRLISQLGKISNHLDLGACTERGVAVAEGVGSPIATAELCWALILAASRRLPTYIADLRAGVWQSAHRAGLGRALHGRTLGIWGYGRIGSMVAGYGRAFGMDVLVFGGERARSAATADGCRVTGERAELFSASDVLSLHLRLVETTRGIVGAADLARMKSDALFVNTARAELVAQGALEAALDAGRPGQAALDVFEEEPIRGVDHPLVSRGNVLCTPHLGYVEVGNYERSFRAAFENVVAFAAGRPQNIANPEVLRT